MAHLVLIFILYVASIQKLFQNCLRICVEDSHFHDGINDIEIHPGITISGVYKTSKEIKMKTACKFYVLHETWMSADFNCYQVIFLNNLKLHEIYNINWSLQ